MLAIQLQSNFALKFGVQILHLVKRNTSDILTRTCAFGIFSAVLLNEMHNFPSRFPFYVFPIAHARADEHMLI